MKKLFNCIIVGITCPLLLCAAVLLIFYVKEPGYITPVSLKSKNIPIRSDSWGEGCFGAKRSSGRLHTGIDILARQGTPVYAAKSGILVMKNLKTGYGKLAIIYHINGTQTRYAHLSKFNYVGTRWVNRKDTIGFVGKTGNAYHKGIRPHLHFEIRKQGKPVDPMKYLSKRVP